MDTQLEQFIVDSNSNSRLDKYLSDRFSAYSRSYFQRLIENRAIFLNKKPAKKRFLVQLGDEISLTFQTPNSVELTPYDLPLEIIYEDEDLIAINKPYGLVTHPAPGHYDKTLVNALLSHLGGFKGFSDTLRPGIIHRLDKDTSGVILCAKTPFGHNVMSEAFAQRKVKKTYLALCHNRPKVTHIDAPIKRHDHHRKKMTINPHGKPSKTELEILGFNERYSLVVAKPITGRTHQIRVHLKSIECPIVSDPIYGHVSKDHPRLMLHAQKLSFIHPKTHKEITIEAKLDKEFQTISDQILQEKNPYC